MITTRNLPSPVLAVPPDVTAVFTHFLTCEVTTVGRSGLPVTWPMMPLYRADRGTFVLFTSIGLPQKAFNVQRNPRVALLFSDATGSDLTAPPTVLVQGAAVVDDALVANLNELEPELFELMRRQTLRMVLRQPAMKWYTNNPLSRWLMDWYFMRLLITVTPQCISWWPAAVPDQPPHVLEVSDVV